MRNTDSQRKLHVMHTTDVKSINWLGVIAIIGALLMIIGVFVSWVSIDLGIWGGTESASGWEIATDDDEGMFSYNYAPLIALVCGIISLIAKIVPMVLPAKNIGKTLGAVGLILAIVALILTALFYSDLDNAMYGIGEYLDVGAGVWIVIVGSVITILGGIIDIVKKPAKPEPSENPRTPAESSETREE